MKTAEIRIIDGHIKANYEEMIAEIDVCQEDVIIFPQYSLTGLHVGKKFSNPSFISDVMYFQELLMEYPSDKTVIFGSIIEEDDKLYSAILTYKDGERVGKPYIKTDLDTYEKQFFSTKESDSKIILDSKEWTLSFTKEGADSNTIVIAHDAFDKNDVETYQAGVYVNRLGLATYEHKVLVYTGGSYVQSKVIEEYQSIENQIIKDADTKVERLYNAVTSGIKWFDEIVLPFGPKWIVGVSGGLDSSLTVALLSLTLGSDRVIGVNMPSDYTRDITKSNAHHLASVLGYESYVIPIQHMTQGTKDAFSEAGLGVLEGLTYENVQARLRGHTLMTLSSIKNGVISNNGNKIETALGYATLYGDAIGVMGILADLNKLEVGQLAAYINTSAEQEVIPSNLIPTINAETIEWDFAPSAELSTDQFDPMKWGYHDHLIEYLQHHSVESYLQAYLDNSILDLPMGPYLKAYGLDDSKAFIADLEWIINTKNRAVYKRLQSPPILTLSKRNFDNEVQGRDMRSFEYQMLVNSILKDK